MPPTLPCLVLLAASLCVGGLSRAMAQGPSALRRVLEAVRAQPDLIRQTNVELPRRDLKAAGIICRAALHGEDWQLMGGGRAPIPTQQRRSQFAHRSAMPQGTGSGAQVGAAQQGAGQFPPPEGKVFS